MMKTSFQAVALLLNLEDALGNGSTDILSSREYKRPDAQVASLRRMTSEDESIGVPIDQAPVTDVVVDVGSTGTRVYLYEHHMPTSLGAKSERVGKIEIGGGLANSWENDNGDFKEHLDELKGVLRDIALPRKAKVLIYGTGGMRQTGPNSDLIWAKVREELVEDESVLGGASKVEIEVRTISGTEEALFCFLAANCLIKQEQDQGLTAVNSLIMKDPWATFELGGSSWQFGLPQKRTSRLRTESYAFGSRTGWEKLKSGSSEESAPCTFTGDGDGAAKCQKEIESQFGQLEEEIQNHINEFHIEPEDWNQVNLLGVSVFFYLVDLCRHIRVLPNDQIAFTPSELKEAATKLCAYTFEDLLEKGRSHQYSSKAKYIRSRCFEANFIVKLFEWYKIPDGRRIHFRKTINGEQAEWATGALMTAYDMQMEMFPSYFSCSACDRETDTYPNDPHHCETHANELSCKPGSNGQNTFWWAEENCRHTCCRMKHCDRSGSTNAIRLEA